jgi:hypothetical protein
MDFVRRCLFVAKGVSAQLGALACRVAWFGLLGRKGIPGQLVADFNPPAIKIGHEMGLVAPPLSLNDAKYRFARKARTRARDDVRS